MRERGTRCLGIRDQAADRHQTPHVKGIEACHRVERPLELARCEPRLRRIVVDVDLHEHGVAAGAPGTSHVPCQAIEALGQADRIDRLDHIERLERTARLVGLQGPDEMPRDAGQRVDLPLGLLDTVLAERRDPGIDRCAKTFRLDGLGDRDERDRRWFAARTLACGRDARLDGVIGRTEGVDLGRSFDHR